jgi:hypothetical protein
VKNQYTKYEFCYYGPWGNVDLSFGASSLPPPTIPSALKRRGIQIGYITRDTSRHDTVKAGAYPTFIAGMQQPQEFLNKRRSWHF